MKSAELKYTVQCAQYGEIHNLVYSAETFGRTSAKKPGSIRGKTKHADCSSHSESPPLATKKYTSTKTKHSGKETIFRVNTFSRHCTVCSAWALKGRYRLFVLLTEWRTLNERQKWKPAYFFCSNPRWPVCHVYSPSDWGVCPGLTSCPFWSGTSVNNRQSSRVWGVETL